jgi:hypothetical protein
MEGNLKHTHMLKFIKELLFGRRAKPVCTINTSLRTVQPTTHATSFGDWCKEFNVSMLHDRKPLHLN